jgi:hypothetical protein
VRNIGASPKLADLALVEDRVCGVVYLFEERILKVDGHSILLSAAGVHL